MQHRGAYSRGSLTWSRMDGDPLPEGGLLVDDTSIELRVTAVVLVGVLWLGDIESPVFSGASDEPLSVRCCCWMEGVVVACGRHRGRETDRHPLIKIVGGGDAHISHREGGCNDQEQDPFVRAPVTTKYGVIFVLYEECIIYKLLYRINI